jgi:ketosteroid isomerase-like protein
LDIEALIAGLYSAFNRRDVDAALACMTEHVRWPKASEGGSVVGKEEIRAYWTRQWAQVDPHVDPVAVTELPDGRIEVRVHQVVRSLAGDLQFDGEVLHLYQLRDGLIEAMSLEEESETPSAAFRH